MTPPALLAALRRPLGAPAARRLGAWGLRGGALAVSLASGLVLAAHVAVSTGTLRLDPYGPALQAAIDARSGGGLGFGDVALARREGGGPVELVLTDVSLARPGGAVRLPDLSLTLDTGAVLRGDLAPRFVTARGGELTLVRTREGLRVGEAMGRAEGGGAPFALAGLVDRARQGGFEGVRLTDTTVRVRSDLSDQSLLIEGARVDVWAQADGYAAAATAPLGPGRVALRAEVHGGTPRAEVLLSRVPPRALAGLFPALPARAARTSLSGEAILEGGVMRFDIAAAPGAVETPLGPRRLRRAEARGAFDLAARRLRVDRARFALGADEATLSGTLDLGGAPRFDAVLSALTVTPPGYEAPLPVTGGTVRGAWAAGRLTLDALARVPGGAVTADGALTFGPAGSGGPGVTLRLTSDDPLATDTLLALWPHRVAPGARGWTEAHVLGGTAEALTLDLALPLGRTPSAPLPDDALRLSLGLRDAGLAYWGDLPPVKGTDALVTLDLNRLAVAATGGRVGEASLTRADVTIDALRTPEAALRVEAAATGAAPSLLALADAPPLGLIGRAGLAPGSFDGEGAFTLRVARGLAPDAAPPRVTGEGRFAGLTLEGLPAGIVLSGAEGTVRLTEAALTVESGLEVQGVPARGRLVRTLGEGGATRIEATATLTPADADVLGLPVRRYASGDAPARFVLTGTDRLERGELTLDLTDARLDVPALGLRKPIGERGAGRVTLTLPPGEPPRLSALKLVTDDVLVEGSARFDAEGGLVRLELPRVFSEGHANLAAVMTRRPDGLHLDVEGRYADLGGLVARVLTGGAGGEGGDAGPGELPLTVSASLDEARLRGGAVVTDLRAGGRRAGGALALSLSGGLGAGRLAFELGPDPDGVGREVMLRADEVGLLLEGLFGITSVEGGAARLRAVAVRDGPLAGSVEADAIVLRDAPLIARLLSVGSLDGLAGVLNGEGLRFDEFAGDFVLRNGRLGLQDVRLTGSALGLSAGGEVDLGARLFDLSGAVAPAYGVNSLLGGIPGLGDLFVSRRGEGVVAFGYAVDGPIAEPTVTVNTLSALTPGVFRRIFEPVRQRRPTTDEILEAATRAAGSREERMTATRAEDMLSEETARDEAGPNARGD